MAYEKPQVLAGADSVFGGINAVRDGIGVEDTGAAINLFTALAGCADEFKSNLGAAICHFIGRLADRFGDYLQEKAEEGST